MGREHRRSPHFLERRVEAPPFLAEIADTLQHDESRVPFVEVIRGRITSHCLERAHAADSQDDLLLHPRLAVAAVESRRQLAIPRRVLLEVGVEQIQLYAAEMHEPHRHQHCPVAKRHGGDARLAVGRHRRRDRRIGPVQLLVDLFLPPVEGDVLAEIALRIHESDADERHTEVAGFLAVIAGQDPEAAGVDRQRLMKCEFGGKVGDGSTADFRKLALDPRVVRRAGGVEPGAGAVVERQPFWIVERSINRFRRQQLQHAHGVVRGEPPEGVVETPKDIARVGIPAPPKIIGQLVES